MLLAVPASMQGCQQASRSGPAAPAGPAAQGSPGALAPGSGAVDASPELMERARLLARRFLIIDGHIDVPHRLHESRRADGALSEDISRRTEAGDFDHVRARAGGLDAPFFSIYVPVEHQAAGAARLYADALIDMVEGFAARWPEQFALARSVAELEERFAEGKMTLLLGIENGAAIEDDLANVGHFHARGVRYVTLTHAEDNQICDSSYDERRTWKGLSPFGRNVIAEMNRVGVMIDVSHVSDQAFDQVLALTRAPVIASHSSARHFTPGFERNMSDDMIRRMAENGGVVMINFGSSFLRQDSRAYWARHRAEREAFAEARGLDTEHPDVKAHMEAWRGAHPPVRADVSDVVDHIDHVAAIAGVDHVGFGSDFDGVGDSLPTGLRDVSFYPNLIRVLLERGYSEQDIEKMCSGNLLRVWRAVEEHARQARGDVGPDARPGARGEE